MTIISLKWTALALAGFLAAATGAQAGGLFDNDNNGYSSQDNGQSFRQYCRENPHDDDCSQYNGGYRQKRHSHDNGRCAALIRAVGKRNLVTAFARNSARFAWAREARFVHGGQYANWNYARNAEISCTYVGALKSCVARGNPCRY
ncbi:MAG: hypothetical protein HC850_12270 [Rhodomicrobium sp.]|nr:hypothetical protein [Rhodomicrobium sp.]